MDKRVFLRSAAVGWVGDQEGMKGIQYPSDVGIPRLFGAG